MSETESNYDKDIFELFPDIPYRVENKEGQHIVIQTRHMPPWIKVDYNDRSISFILDELPKEAYCIKVFKDV